MERVETLLQKLQQQFTNGADAAQLLLTVQMLQHELLHLQQAAGQEGSVTVSMPLNIVETTAPVAITPAAKPAEEEKIIQVLQVDEAEIEAELEEIKRNAAAKQKIGSQSRPQLLFEGNDDDIPTLAQHIPAPQPATAIEKKEVNEQNISTESLNDKLKINKIELSEKFNESGIKDLKKAIGINDRFLFINELFRGDEAMYERSIKTINSFSILAEAEYWIRRELKTKLGWIESDTVKQFDQLIKRRFT
ncbi:hypothetical protein [Ferruginibacter albus]|uniref:hypothetical protein n=1 Tax=Ferruginibacter albus TaxID=2875540 RepID=UPI001CC6DC2F|nr:hypothetical protein [Ferruginibacter albus]UAY52543.1 hypothetical protein K9M53_02355 [Ferruginibacter albus]